MANKEVELDLILEYVGGPQRDPDSYQLWACRGARKGCKKRTLKTKRHCTDCYLPNLDDTMGEIIKRLERGDA